MSPSIESAKIAGSQNSVESMHTQASQPFTVPAQAAPIHQALQALEQRELVLPCLLFVASHRPCAFVVSQLLYVVGPLAAILGLQTWQDWALVLSEPDGAAWLEQTLTDMTCERQSYL